MTLPKVSLNMARITPFKRKSGVGPKRFYEDIQLSYTGLLENRINTYDSLLFTDQVWDNMQNGYRHNIPLSLSIKPFRKKPMLQSFAITPSLNYNGVAYTKQREYYLDDEGEPQYRTISKLSYAHSLYPSIGSGLAPQVYGMYTFSGKGRLQQKAL